MVGKLLEVKNLQAFYGSSQVLFGVNLAVTAGTVHALLGRNGMGKTTTVRSIMGVLRSKRGDISFAGRSIGQLLPEQIASLGVAWVPEGRGIFPNLTVEEHLVAFARNHQVFSQAWTLSRIYDLFPRLWERRRNLGTQLSGGEQQMLAIGRALSMNPRLLILDEATEGLAPLLREEIWRVIRHLKTEGLTILIIDKHVEKVLSLADEVTILEKGKVVWQGRSVELRDRPDIWGKYLGV